MSIASEGARFPIGRERTPTPEEVGKMRRTLVSASAVVLTLIWSASFPTTAWPDATGTVRAVVRYETASGSKPLEGVWVWLGISGAESMYGCTNAKGLVRFLDVPARTDLLSATGPGERTKECTNPFFLNPDTGKEMTGVGWDDHHGEGVWDSFRVGADETVTLRYVVQTPDQRGELCFGAWATWVGTSGRDRFSGTSGSDVVNARGGNDLIRGMDGFDILCGGAGDDTLRGGADIDTLVGGSGDDVLFGGPGDDLALWGGPGRDRCEGENAWRCE